MNASVLTSLKYFYKGATQFLLMTGSNPRCPIQSHSLACIENHLFIVEIGQILNKELEFIYRSDRSDRTYVYC